MGVKEYLEEKYPDCKIIYLIQSGSRLHGTATEKSDTDYKGLFVPSVESIIRGKDLDVISFSTGDLKSANTKDDIDYEIFSIKKFLYLLSRGEAGSVDLLFSMFSTNNVILYESTESLFFKENHRRLITNKSLAFTGFAISQVNTYTVKGERVQALDEIIKVLNEVSKLFTKAESNKQLQELSIDGIPLIDYLFSVIDNKHFFYTRFEEKDYLDVLNRKFEYGMSLSYFLKSLITLRGKYGSRAAKAAQSDGLDFKAFSHAVRAVTEAISLVKDGFIQFPLPNASLLLDIKIGKYTDIQYLTDMVDDFILELEEETKKSNNPENIDSAITVEALNYIYNLKDDRCSTYALEK